MADTPGHSVCMNVDCALQDEDEAEMERADEKLNLEFEKFIDENFKEISSDDECYDDSRSSSPSEALEQRELPVKDVGSHASTPITQAYDVPPLQTPLYGDHYFHQEQKRREYAQQYEQEDYNNFGASGGHQPLVPPHADAVFNSEYTPEDHHDVHDKDPLSDSLPRRDVIGPFQAIDKPPEPNVQYSLQNDADHQANLLDKNELQGTYSQNYIQPMEYNNPPTIPTVNEYVTNYNVHMTAQTEVLMTSQAGPVRTACNQNGNAAEFTLARTSSTMPVADQLNNAADGGHFHKADAVENYMAEQPSSPGNDYRYYDQNTDPPLPQSTNVFSKDVPFSAQRFSQLHILYQARGRELQEVQLQFAALRESSDREVRVLKHKLRLLEAERDGAVTSRQQSDGVLLQQQHEAAELQGTVNSLQAQIENLQTAKEQLLKKLTSAETTIEQLNLQLESMEQSETLLRAREQHEKITQGMKKKFEQEKFSLNEALDSAHKNLIKKTDEIRELRARVLEQERAFERSQADHAEHVNRLTHTLHDSQRHCQELLESGAGPEASKLKVQLESVIAEKSIVEDCLKATTHEAHELKQQVQMYESLSSVGLVTRPTPADSGRESQNTELEDSYVALGIQRQLKQYDTPMASPRSADDTMTSEATFTTLKDELQRSLVLYRGKRDEASKLAKELEETKKKLEKLESEASEDRAKLKQTQERCQELESLVDPNGSFVDSDVSKSHLLKEVEALKKDSTKKQKLNDELQSRLEEVAANEQTLSEQNRDLSRRLAEMVREADEDKEQALARHDKAMEEHLEATKKELQQLHATEQKDIAEKYQKEIDALRSEVDSGLFGVKEAQDLYVQVCTEKDGLQQQLNEIKEKMEETDVEMLREKWEKEHQKRMELEVAKSKLQWMEEQQEAKRRAVEEALAAERDDTSRLLSSEFDSVVQTRLDKAKGALRLEFEQELQDRLGAAREEWRLERADTDCAAVQADLELNVKDTAEWREIEVRHAAELQRLTESAALEVEQARNHARTESAHQEEPQRAEDLEAVKKEAKVQFEAREAELKHELEALKLELVAAEEKAKQHLADAEEQKLSFEVRLKDEMARSKLWDDKEVNALIEKARRDAAAALEVKHKEEKDHILNTVDGVVAKEKENTKAVILKMKQEADAKVKTMQESHLEELEQAKQQWLSAQEDIVKAATANVLQEQESMSSVLKEELATSRKMSVSLQEENKKLLDDLRGTRDELMTLRKNGDADVAKLRDELQTARSSWAQEKLHFTEERDNEKRHALAELESQNQEHIKNLSQEFQGRLKVALQEAREQASNEREALESKHADVISVMKQKLQRRDEEELNKWTQREQELITANADKLKHLKQKMQNEHVKVMQNALEEARKRENIFISRLSDGPQKDKERESALADLRQLLLEREEELARVGEVRVQLNSARDELERRDQLLAHANAHMESQLLKQEEHWIKKLIAQRDQFEQEAKKTMTSQENQQLKSDLAAVAKKCENLKTMHEHSIQSLKAKLKDRDGDLQALRRELDENELERAELGRKNATVEQALEKAEQFKKESLLNDKKRAQIIAHQQRQLESMDKKILAAEADNKSLMRDYESKMDALQHVVSAAQLEVKQERRHYHTKLCQKLRSSRENTARLIRTMCLKCMEFIIDQRLPKDEALPLMERTLERCSTGGSASGSSSLVTTPRDDVSTVAKTLNDPPPVETAQSFTIISATPPPCASPLPSRRRQGSPSRKSQPHKPVERSLSPFDKQWQHSVAAQNSPSKQRSKTSVSQQKAPNGRHFESVQTRDFNRAGSPSRRNYTDLDRDMMRSAPPDILSRRQRYLRPDCDIGRDDGRGDGGCHRNDHRRPVSKQGELSSDSDSVNGRKPVNYYYREKVPPLDLGFGDEGHDKKMLNDISGFQYTPLGVAPSLRKSRPVIPKERSLESIFRASLGEKFETDDLRTSAERDSSDGSTPRQQQEPAYVTERSRDHSRDFVAHVSKTTQIPTPGPK